MSAELVEIRKEMLDGKIYAMTQPSANHGKTKGNIFNVFENYLENSTCGAWTDGTAVYLDDKNYVIPDFMVVCNRSSVKEDGIHGAPTLIAEVLSPSTAYKDRGYKKELYERSGVQEYWIVDPKNKTIEVYLLKGTQYVFEATYVDYPEWELSKMTEEEKKSLVTEISPSMFQDLKIPINRIFKNLL